MRTTVRQQTDRNQQKQREHDRRDVGLSYSHLALLVVALMSLALITVGIVVDGSSPLFFILPTLLVYVAIRGLRR